MARILLAFDGSDGSLGAATALSHWDLHGSEVCVLTVLTMEDWPSRKVSRMRETLARNLRRRGAHTELLLRRGSPSASILELAAERDVDLIVLGPRKRPSLTQRLLGRVSWDVICRAPCSVLVGRLSLATERAMVVLEESEDLRLFESAWKALPLPRQMEVFIVGLLREVPAPAAPITAEMRHQWPQGIPKVADVSERSRIEALLAKSDAFLRGHQYRGISIPVEGTGADALLKYEHQVTPELVALGLDCSSRQRQLIAEAHASVLLMKAGASRREGTP